MLMAVQIFCGIVAFISAMAFLVEKNVVHLTGAFGFTVLIVAIEVYFK